jgi:uncharacterized cupredoxin-like copper-binding protein
MRRLSVIAIVAMATATGLAGCGGDDRDPARTVNATVSEFQISLDKSSMSSGKIWYVVTNGGVLDHDFVLYRTDLAANALPVDEDGDVEDDLLPDPVDELEDIAPTKSPTLTVTLVPGAYVLICTQSTHYGQGMRAGFTVT